MSQKPTYEELKNRVRELEKAEIEHKKFEETLQKKIQRFRDLAENTNDWKWEIDMKGLYTYSNRKGKESLGYEPEEFIGKTPFDLMSIEESKRVSALLNTFILSRSSFDSIENLKIHKNGSRVVMETSGVPILGNEGELLGYRGVDRDITHRKNVEETLKKNKDELDSIFRAAPTGIGLVNDRVITQINNRFCEMTGYSKSELIGQNARILYPTDEDYEYVGKEKYRQIKTLGTGTVETRFKRKDGEIIHVLMSSTPIDPTNLLAGVTFTALDITERKQIEEELKVSEEHYREYFEENISGSYISSPEGRLIACNEEYRKIFGFDNIKNALDTPIIDFFNDTKDRINFLNIIEKEKRVTGYEPNLMRSDGTAIHLLENASGVFDEDGNLKQIRGFLLDVTKQKKLEAQLQQAQKMEAIGTLAGGIAHDFNNILFPVLGHTEILLQDALEDSPLYDSLKKIYKGAIRARDLVSQILTFSRQKEVVLTPIKLHPIVKEVIEFIRSTIPTSIEIIADVSNSCGNVKADPTQIHQIVMNLTTNAYHAMGDNGGKLKVSLKEIESNEIDVKTSDMRPGRYACLNVSDTGIGMKKKTTEKIFEPFFTTKEKGKGTGMGLAVVHGIVAHMNGTIQVHSEFGKGTYFNVYLPIERRVSEKKRKHFEKSIHRGVETILIVDDEEDIAIMEETILKRLGYQVVKYTNSIEALEAFCETPDKFDMVITDMAMPSMPGDKLAVELIKTRPDIPILLCTGFSETISDEKVASIGVKGLVMKPVAINKFVEKVRHVLDEVAIAPSS